MAEMTPSEVKALKVGDTVHVTCWQEAIGEGPMPFSDTVTVVSTTAEQLECEWTPPEEGAKGSLTILLADVEAAPCGGIYVFQTP